MSLECVLFVLATILVVALVIYIAGLRKQLSQFDNWKSPKDFESFVNSRIIAVETKTAEAVKIFEEDTRLREATRAYENFRNWKQQEIEGIRAQERSAALASAENALTEWRQTEEDRIRADAVNRSQAISKGKITEHLVPFFPEFSYNPKDARFLGSPVDLLVFNGLSDGELREIVFLEIKTGGSQLTARERQIRTKLEEGRIRWEELRIA